MLKELSKTVEEAPKSELGLGERKGPLHAATPMPQQPVDLAHHLDEARGIIYSRPEAMINENPVGDFEMASQHLKQVPGSEKAQQRLGELHNWETTRDPEMYEAGDLDLEERLHHDAYYHSLDELANQHGVPRIHHPDEMVDFVHHETPIVNDLVQSRPVYPQYQQKLENFMADMQKHLKETGSTERGAIADWLQTHWSKEHETGLGRLIEKHDAMFDPEDPGALRDMLVDHFFESPDKDFVENLHDLTRGYEPAEPFTQPHVPGESVGDKLKRLQQSVESLPGQVEQIPQAVEKIPEAVEKIPQSVDKLSKFSKD